MAQDIAVADEIRMRHAAEPEQADELEREGTILSAAKRSNSDAYYKIRSLAGDDLSRLDWPAIRSALVERTGLPVRVTLRSHAQNGTE